MIPSAFPAEKPKPYRTGAGYGGRMLIYLETGRLVLRRLTGADLDNLVELDADPEVMRYLTGGVPTPRAEIRDNILPALLGCYQRVDGYGYWAVQRRDDDTFLGWFALRPKRSDPADQPELGYRLNRAAWGRGYATEGSLALIRHAFSELGARRVYAQTMAVNAGSRRVMEKAGLVYVRTFHEHFDNPIEGTEFGEVEYALDLADWQRYGSIAKP